MNQDFSPGTMNVRREEQERRAEELKANFWREARKWGTRLGVGIPVLAGVLTASYKFNCLKGDDFKCPIDPDDYAKIVNVARTQFPQPHLIEGIKREADFSRTEGDWRRCAAATTHLIPAYKAMFDFRYQKENDRRGFKLASWMTYLDPLIMSATDGQKFDFPGATLTIHTNDPFMPGMAHTGSAFTYTVDVDCEGGVTRRYDGKGKTFSTNPKGGTSPDPDWTLSRLITNGKTSGAYDICDLEWFVGAPQD